MADNLGFQEGTFTKSIHTKERASNIHNEVVELNIGGASEVLAGGSASGIYVQGPAADGAAPSGNPVLNAGQAVGSSGVFPTAVDAADLANLLLDLKKRLIVAQHDPGTFKHYSQDYSTQQTGTALLTPASGKRIMVTHLNVMVAGTTAGIVTVWTGGSADTTYTAATDRTIFRQQFYPSSTNAPGAVMDFANPFVGEADYVVRLTTSAAMTCYIQVSGFEY